MTCLSRTRNIFKKCYALLILVSDYTSTNMSLADELLADLEDDEDDEMGMDEIKEEEELEEMDIKPTK